MRKASRASVLFALSLAALATGCSHMHRVVNTGDMTLYAVDVRSGAYVFGHGILPPRVYKTYGGSMRIRHSPPPVISWKTNEHGQVLSQPVELKRWPPWGEVVFELDGRTVTGFRRDR
jgi:hypothetical protein